MNDWIKPYLKQHKGQILLSILFGVLGIGSGAMLLFVSGYLISKSSLRPENIMIVYIPIVSVRAFSIGQAVFNYVEKLVSHDLVLRILENMRTKLYEVVEPQALLLRSRYQTGDLLGVLADDIEHLQDFYLRTIFPSILGMAIYTIFIIVLGLFDWIFAIMMALMLGVILFLVPIISLFITRRDYVALKKRRHTLYRQLTDAVFGRMDWQASGRTSEVIKNFAAENERLIHFERKIRQRKHLRNGTLHFIVGVIVIAMMVWADFKTGQGTISPTVIAAFVLMTFSITDALLPVADAVEEVPSYTDSIERIQQIDEQPITQKQKKPVQAERHPYKQATLKLHQVSYRYRDRHDKTIENFSLHIPAGEKIAILGKSGTGKSTLLKLMSGVIEPDEGEIIVNGTTMHSQYLSEAVSVLNQKPHLFNTTIGNNIRIGKPKATDEELWRVAEQAQIASLIRTLPQGMDTPMEEMGQRFSGGERQRIAFARVLLQNTPIILMDEPTIGLDPATEQQLLTTFLSAAKEKTIIWVTHHLAGAKAMDQVIFMENGTITMQGNHDELYQSNKHYQRLYQMDQGTD